MPSLRQFFYDRYKDIETADHRLLYLFLEVTRECNLSCRHCGSDCGAGNAAATLRPEDWFSLVDSVCARFSRDLLFVVTGGEPLVWPHLPALGRRIRDNGRRWGMVTNGFALDAAALDRLTDAGLTSVTVSLDGGEEAHNRLRNHPLAHERAGNAISLVARSPIPFADVVTCVYPQNLDGLSGVADRLLDLGIRHWRLFRIFPRGRAAEDPGLLLSREQGWRMLEWIAENRPRYRKAGLSISLSCEGWLPFSWDRKVRVEPFFCRSGISIASILCDGTVTGCPNNPRAFRQGNVRVDDLARIWEDGFGPLRDRGWMRRGLCADCRRFTHCRGGSAHLWDDAARSSSYCYVRP